MAASLIFYYVEERAAFKEVEMNTRPSEVETVGLRSTRRRSVVVASLLLIVVLSLLAAACGGGSASSDQASTDQLGQASTDQPGNDPAQTTDAGGQTTDAGGQTTDGGGKAPLPGIKEFGLTEEEYAAHIEAVQALIASCMTEAGFEYVPASVQTVALAQYNVRKKGSYSVKKEYKEKWGYDVSTRYENKIKNIELGPQNLRIIKGLSEADRVAYERTLYGEDPNATFAFTFDEEDFSGTGGCTRKAVEQVFTPEQLKETYINPKDILIESDPRVVEANANWVACMQDAGYDGYLEHDDIIGEFEERFDALTEGEDPRTLTGARAEELKQMQAEEIAISLADLECEQDLDLAVHQVELEVLGVALD